MVDRTDIDALLIGALYGELTPADEARLMAHLESHPADRTALDNLTRTRAAVRDSRILAFQAEPPQSISALLLQEASRRAPRRVDHSETATWFQRFVRSFMAHPAMAAAATLVLVIAAAGTLYLRGTDQFASTAAPAPERAAPAEPSAPAAAAPAAEPAGAPGAGTATGDSIGTLSGAGAGSSAEPAQPTRFDDSAAAKGQAAEGQAAEPRTDSRGSFGAPEDRLERPKRARAPSKAGVYDDRDFGKLRASPEESKADKREAVRGIELRTPQLAPKELKDSEKESADEKPNAGRRATTENGRAAGESTRDGRNAAVAGGGAAAAAPAAPPPPPPASAPAPSRSPGPAAAADSDLPQAVPSNDARRPAAKVNQQRLVPENSANSANSAQNAQNERRLDKAGNATATTTANASPDAARQAQLLDWARKQREQVISLVNANRCREAASAAVEIYNRAPEYFNANVATDRQIKPCLAYVNDQRDRAERSRATKNAADVQAPAQAAPVRK